MSTNATRELEEQPLLIQEAKVAKEKVTKCCSGFSAWLKLRGNIFDLAIAFIMGGAFQAVVTSMVNDILMPPVGLLGGANFENLFWVLKKGELNNA